MSVLLLVLLAEPAAPKWDPARWEAAVAKMERRDREKPPPKEAIVFAGSSSVRLWNLAKSFPGVAVVNRGFGGSHLADSTHFAPRLILPLRPRRVVLYAGDNDIAAGKSPERVRDDFLAFVKVVHDKLPKTPIVFLSIKPSLLRWRLAEKMKRTNALIAAECKKDDRLVYVDVWTPMLGKDGKPRRELFVFDGLHLSAAGYKVWAEALKPHLK
jgi:lysophospholipase L1-like esterase